MRFNLTILFSLVCFISFNQNNVSIDQPKAEKIPYYFVTHGDSVLQNYNWMREKNSPKVVNYLHEENRYADLKMKNSSILQKKIYEDMRSRMKENHVSRPKKKKGYYYYTKNVEGKDYQIYCRKKDSLSAKEEIIFDLNELTKTLGFFNITSFNLSEDGKRIYFSYSTDGGIMKSIFKIRDIENDTILSEEINDISSYVVDELNNGIYYLKAENKSKLPSKIYFHKFGEKQEQDQLIYQKEIELGSIGCYLSTSKQYLFILSSVIGESGEINYIDLLSKEKTIVPYLKNEKKISNSLDHIKGDEFILYTNKNAKNYHILKVKIKDINSQEVIIRENKDERLTNYVIKKDYFILTYRKDGLNYLQIKNIKSNVTIPLYSEDSIGVIGINDELKEDSLNFEYYVSSLKRPTTIFQYNMVLNTKQMVWQDSVINYNINDYITERIWSTSRDGKKVPIDLIYNKKLKKDGENLLYVTGYASYGDITEPTFNSSNLIYLEKGFIYAIIHARGESLLGDEWYEGGKLLNKKNTFHDFVDATQFLIDQKYTSSKKIVAQGGSAGGLLMGAIANEKPELYGAIIANVPFVNVLEDMMDTLWPNIKYHFNEIGNPFKKDHYDYIKSYSPLHNVEAKNYPNMLVTCGYHDQNVPYWAPVQYVAKLRELKTDSNLLLLKTNMESGHFGSAGRYNYLKDKAFEVAFAMRSLGIKEDYITISGKVVDSKGEPIPFVNVFIDGTINGTASNIEGEFSLDIREGNSFNLIFQSVGFKKFTYKIDQRSKIKDIIITLPTEGKELEEVVIKVKGKDRGYEIIKKAIEKKSFYNEKLDNFSVDIYVKGVERLDSIPKKLPSFILIENLPDTNDLGLMSLSESVARYHFQKPDNYKEEMLSSKVAGQKNGISWNRVSSVNFNFYENNIETSFMEKPFISPIANGGILLYKYHLEGKIKEDDGWVYKIKVTPRNVTEAVFSGYVYINDKNWSLHSVDLNISKLSGIEFMDSMYIKQIYGFTNDSVSVPRSVHFNVRYKIFGFQGGMVSVGSFYNYKFNQKFDRKFFQKQVYSIAEDANKKDTSYWQKERPIQLTTEESKYYVKVDTITKKVRDDKYFDSIQKIQNKITPMKILIIGYTYKNKGLSYHLGGLMADPGYNTVEGLRIQNEIRISKDLTPKSENQGWFMMNSRYISLKTRYGLSSQKWYGAASIGENRYNEQYNWSINGGKYISQYNQSEPVNQFVDAAYNLILRQNFAKFYEKNFVSASFSNLMDNGIRNHITLEYAQRSALINHEDWFLFSKVKNQLTSNNPMNPLSDSIAFPINNAFTIKYKGSFTIGERYEMIYSYRRSIDSRYPTVYWGVDQGLKILNSKVGYTKLQLGIGKDFKLGYWGLASLDIISGCFFNNKDMYFTDYKHFNGNQTLILKNGSYSSDARTQLDQFNAMNYYGFSTNKNYLELHYQHRFLGVFTNKIPLFNRLHLYEVAGVNALYTSNKVNYQELFVGIDNIGKIFRVDLVATYRVNEKLIPLVRFGLKKAF